jgi:hypothetical protein
MILISFKGGTKKQRDLTEDAARYFVKKLLPRKRKLHIDFHIRNTLKEDAAGYCSMLDNANDFLIELHHRGTLYDYVSYLAHEMVHLKQYTTKEMNEAGMWKGVDHSKTAYSKQPWEREAWAAQHNLAKDFIKNKLGLTLKDAKNISPRTMKEINWDLEIKHLEDICNAQS